MIPVYETARFRREANKCGLDDFADELRDRFTKDPDPSVHFEGSLPQRTWYLIKKRKGFVVGRFKTVKSGAGPQDVFCLMRVIGFDDPGRVCIVGVSARDRVSELSEGLDLEDLQVFVDKWQTEQAEGDGSADQKPPLPDDYAKWLETPRWHAAGDLDPLDLVVYETKEWRRRMSRIVDHWAEIHTALVEFIWDKPQGVPYECACPGVRLIETQERVLILCIYRGLEAGSQRRLLMLIDAFDENNPDADTPSRGEWLAKVDSNVLNSLDSGSVDRLARRAIRAYPGLYLDQNAYEAWKLIEKDESANLAMSPEEEALLTRLTGTSREVHIANRLDGATSAEDSMPAFINGRAGSGKSTVLYYLFAHYWMYGKQKDLPGHPVFLTLNGRLLNSARKTVKSILEADCRYLSSESANATEVMADLETAFRPFRSILLETIQPSRRDRFAEDREIDFDIFRRLILCEEDPRYPAKLRFMGRLDRWCTPELCWHVIRSYIKGFSPRGLMDVGAYRALPRMDRSVENTHFDWVFAKVWPWYEGLTQSGPYWDQLDLAREVLSGLTEGAFDFPEKLRDCGAVFCDEAQDLTGVELSLVLRLSVFARHDLHGLRHVDNIPIAFAGDPLQTLNPTGFRWQNLTSSFYRNLLEPLRLHKALTKSELNFNYRSPKLVTRLANLVQFSRRAVFQDNYLKPQRPWSLEDGVPPARFEIPKTLTDNEVAGLQDSFILLPCAEGHEQEFATQYPVLLALKNTTSPPELISVSAAKGLDLKKVVVFAFGEELFSEGIPDPDDDEEHGHDVGLAYALNQLYVAVTRSTDELLIMDTRRGHEMLWEQLFDRTKIETWLGQIDAVAADAWREVLPEEGLPLWNTAVEFAPLRAEDLRAQAESLKNSGRELRRAEFMQKAAAFYRKAGRTDEERECKAFAAWYSGHHREACDDFRTLKLWKEAADCLWEGRVWSDLAALGDKVDPKRATLAAFKVSDQDSVVRLRSFLDAIDNHGFELESPTVPQWRDVVATLVSVASGVVRTSAGRPDIQLFYTRLGHFLRALGKLGHAGCSELAADCFAGAGDWVSARDIVDVIPPAAKVEYRDLIVAHTAEWPDYVRACNRAKIADLLVDRWRRDGQPTSGLSKDEAAFLFDALWEKVQTKEAIRVAFSGELVQKLWGIRERLTLNEWVKVVGLVAARDRSGLPLEEALDDLWKRRGDLNSDQRLELLEVLCVAGRWEQVAEVAREILDDQPRPIDLNWICDAVAAHPVVGRVSDGDMKIRDTIGDTILAIARKTGGTWPDSELELRRAAAALECLGFDKHMAALGRAYGDSRVESIRNVSRDVYQRARALYLERLDKLVMSRTSRISGIDRREAEQETLEQLARWGLLSLEKGEPFHPPARVVLGGMQQPFERCSTPVREMDGFWITEFAPYAIQVARDGDGGPLGTLEVSRREGRRSKALFVDALTGDLELCDGTATKLSPGEVKQDSGLGGSVELMRTEGSTRIVVRLPPWPDGVTIVLPTP